MAPGTISDVKKQKKSAFSCEPCRTRKVKCGGEKPICNRCKARKDVCIYKLAPTLSYTQKLETRVVELEKALSQAQQADSGQSPRAITSLSPSTTGIEGGSSSHNSAFKGLAFDAKGSVSYHGATSLFQLPSGPRSSPQDGQVFPPSPSLHDSGKQRLVQNAWFQRALEVLSETPEPFQYLLNNHWCWIQPLFNFVYRPAFTRDMQNLGPYYSHTLLNAILAHSVRWCRREPQIRHLLEPYDGGALFSRHARTLLFNEISNGHCKIPTVQVCLLLSAQECSKGNRTQAWVYCGMAFRLIEDMGITIDDQRYGQDVHLSDEDKEVRRRLFWSCYFWDKLISLYLGRSPTLQHSPVSPPQVIMDDSAEDEWWKPHGVTFSPGHEYPLTKARSISCFTHACRLSVVFHEILVHVYDPLQSKSELEVEECLSREGEAMRQWWRDLPEFLRIDALSLPQYSPPSHIVTLNSLYHTFKILLYRPMLFRRSDDQNQRSSANPHHFKECLASATSIVAIFDLFCRTFGYGRVVLSLAYSLYTAASIFLLQIQAASNKDSASASGKDKDKDKESKDDNTLQRMQFCVQALHRVKGASPVIGDALNLILKALSDSGVDTATMTEQQAFPIETSPRQSHTFPMASTSTSLLGQSNQGILFDQLADPQSYHGNGNDGTFSNDNPQLHSPTEDFSIAPPSTVAPAAAVTAFDPDTSEFSPDMFEAFSSLEPIAANVGGVRYDMDMT